MTIPVNAVSKVSQLDEATELSDEDLLFLSEKQGDESFIAKKVKQSTVDAHNDARYIKRTEIYLSVPLCSVIIEK